MHHRILIFASALIRSLAAMRLAPPRFCAESKDKSDGIIIN